jgi:hypothetical protein
MRVKLADRPGSLSELTALLAAHGANLVRFEVASHADEDVWDDLELETPSSAALGSLVRAIRSAGYEVVGLPLNWGVRDWAMEIVETMADIAATDDLAAVDQRLVDAVRTIARTDHGLLLSDQPDGDAASARRRWEMLEVVSADIDSDAVTWSGDPPAIDIAQIALRAVTGSSPTKSSRSRDGGVALLVGGTPRRGVVVAVGGRPPFLTAEVERLRRFVQIVGPWLSHRHTTVLA